MQIYDSIGSGYTELRREDPRIAAHVERALGDSRTVLNVGAGAGSYEPRNRQVVALEPSEIMIAQRRPEAASVIRASAEHLPFDSDSFDTTLSVLTIHHWPAISKSLSELRRVARRRVVILTWDPAAPGFWLRDYFPHLLRIDQRIFPRMSALSEALGEIEITKVLIPSDCSDGFLGAYWNRPEAYLVSEVRQAISTFSKLKNVKAGLARLAEDLETGEWEKRNAELRALRSLDLGYRIVVASSGVPSNS